MTLFCERHIRMSAALCAIVALSACTRTYDGTIVPEYTAQMISSGLIPVYEFRKTDTQPPNRLVQFPPPPAAVEVAQTAKPQKVASRRVRPPVQPVAEQPAATAKKVTCRRDNSDGGRIRVICD